MITSVSNTTFASIRRGPLAILSATIVLACAATPAHAQFPGDVFVENPSVPAQPGDVVELEFLAFSGDTPFGAAGVLIGYDTDSLELLDITGDDAQSPDAALDNGGTVALASVNGEDTDGPIGTQELGTLRFRVADDAVGILNITAQPRGFVSAQSQAFVGNRAFGAEIVVGGGGPGIPAPSFGRARGADTIALRERALKVRRPGFAVSLVDPATGELLRVENIDAAAPVD